MSHLTVCKVSIRNPDVSLLKQVFKVLAMEYKVPLSTFVRDYYGRDRQVIIGLDIIGKGRAKGIGAIIENNELVIIGDEWALGKLFEEIKSKIVQYYVALAVSRIAKTLGFQIANVQQTQEAIVIDLAR